MSPTKRASSVEGLRRAVGTAPLTTPAETPTPVQKESPARPARVTLNMPPELYRELDRWTSTAAETIDVPRVSIQDALRAMVRAGMRDKAAEAAVLTQLSQQELDSLSIQVAAWVAQHRLQDRPGECHATVAPGMETTSSWTQPVVGGETGTVQAAR
jgi:hypothetical protein